MTADPQTLPSLMTAEEYFRFEAAADERHEYRDGVVVAIAGGTYNHSLILMNVGAALHSRLKGGPCRVLESNLRLRIPRKAKYYYGDVPVVCGDPQFDPAAPRSTTVLNPRLIVEVLSDSTEGFDRGEKFADYRDIESFREYALVSQHTPRAEVYLRQEDGSWRFQPSAGLDAVVRLESIGVELPLAEVYASVQWA